MTLAEYSIIIQWQLDERLQWQTSSGAWVNWTLDGSAPAQGFHFTSFRRRPENSDRPAERDGARIETDVSEPQRITSTVAP